MVKVPILRIAGAMTALGLLISACGTPEKSAPGQWTGTVEDQRVSARWLPREPRIGDYVDLRVSLDREELRTSARGTEIAVERSREGSRFRILIREPGDFRPEGWPEVLWTVPEEDHFPEGWQSLESEQPGNSFLWKAAAGILSSAAALLTGLLLYRRKKTVPGRAVPEGQQLLQALEDCKANLHHLNREDMKSLTDLLDRGWNAALPSAPLLSGAWFYRDGMNWAQLESRYRSRRALALFGARDLGWEVWEEEVDAVLFRLRGGHV